MLRSTAFLAIGLSVAGCGHQKVQRSNKPAAVTATQTTSTSRSTPDGTVTGRDILTKFGDVQVALTLKGGRITDVQWLKLPLDRPRSRYISQTAAPILRSEVLSAQSGKINLVSGATYTSDAWANSVQSALSHAH
ncbi:MAG: hypothetical protein QOJ29_4994 [Thermoleophilaceae bacterium]|nr:hypothetical protein [Thermoleophilaceae bacterium]